MHGRCLKVGATWCDCKHACGTRRSSMYLRTSTLPQMSLRLVTRVPCNMGQRFMTAIGAAGALAMAKQRRQSAAAIAWQVYLGGCVQ